eukprot:TRINITY_DN50447_c0_g1_i1.p2 TRINITY_DN50447_c0_g1~~TRINITY_DN50447_c0_g1_i1.p2  ORF type:complete len:188 (+),score=21.75 TRINITY_DN50447_c0_g1_i1:135-698(+)
MLRSLVGSEMCIRDRLKQEQEEQVKERKLRTNAAASSSGSIGARSSQANPWLANMSNLEAALTARETRKSMSAGKRRSSKRSLAQPVRSFGSEPTSVSALCPPQASTPTLCKRDGWMPGTTPPLFLEDLRGCNSQLPNSTAENNELPNTPPLFRIPTTAADTTPSPEAQCFVSSELEQLIIDLNSCS